MGVAVTRAHNPAPDSAVVAWPYLHISIRRSSTTGGIGYTVDASTRPGETDAGTRRRLVTAIKSVEAELGKLSP